MVSVESEKQAADANSTASPPKVDYTADLFDMLSMDNREENGSESASAEDSLWAGFQCMSQNSP